MPEPSLTASEMTVKNHLSQPLGDAEARVMKAVPVRHESANDGDRLFARPRSKRGWLDREVGVVDWSPGLEIGLVEVWQDGVHRSLSNSLVAIGPGALAGQSDAAGAVRDL